MSADAERSGQIEKLRRLPAQIAHLMEGLTSEQLTTPYVAGEWTVAQNVHHLADSHMNSYVRCKLILTEDHPALKPYDQDLWAALPDAQSAAVGASIDLLRSLHARWVDFWETLPTDAWNRPGLHSETGTVTLADLLRVYAAHGEAHIAQIRRTLAAQYPELPDRKGELMARIDREWATLQRLLRHLSPAQMETPAADGWSPKVHVAHITAWENYLLRHLLRGEPAHTAVGIADRAAFAAAEAAGDVDATNALILEVARRQPLDAVLQRMWDVHLDLVAALDQLPWSETQRPRRPESPQTGSLLGGIAGNTYDHYLEHWLILPVA